MQIPKSGIYRPSSKLQRNVGCFGCKKYIPYECTNINAMMVCSYKVCAFSGCEFFEYDNNKEDSEILSQAIDYRENFSDGRNSPTYDYLQIDKKPLFTYNNTIYERVRDAKIKKYNMMIITKYDFSTLCLRACKKYFLKFTHISPRG